MSTSGKTTKTSSARSAPRLCLQDTPPPRPRLPPEKGANEHIHHLQNTLLIDPAFYESIIPEKNDDPTP
ncbi:hypothetical protein ACQ86N_32190 [Puia sp. P3]|uniref:hypothetical protein n=1 Tax=Puia sp. P3 TaxID=3423952 RepID=UPI003D66EF62